MAELPFVTKKDGEYQKTMLFRVYNVFLLSPFLIQVGIKGKNLTGFARLALVGMGIGTMVFNGKNLIEDIL